jgi:hypothetical protein
MDTVKIISILWLFTAPMYLKGYLFISAKYVMCTILGQSVRRAHPKLVISFIFYHGISNFLSCAKCAQLASGAKFYVGLEKLVLPVLWECPTLAA